MAKLRKSLQQHALEGSFRKCRHDGRGDGIPTEGTPQRPDNLKPEERKLWDEWVPICVAMGTAGEADVSAIVQMIRWWLKLELLHSKGVLQSKDVTAASTAFKAWLSLADRFGLAGRPSREKLGELSAADEEDMTDAWLDQFRNKPVAKTYEFVPHSPIEDFGSLESEPAT